MRNMEISSVALSGFYCMETVFVLRFKLRHFMNLNVKMLDKENLRIF